METPSLGLVGGMTSEECGEGRRQSDCVRPGSRLSSALPGVGYGKQELGWAGLGWLAGWYPGVCCPADARLDCFLNQLGVGLSAVAAVAAFWRRRGLWEAAVGRCRGTGVQSSDVGRVKWRFWEKEWMTGQSEAEEISWDGGQPAQQLRAPAPDSANSTHGENSTQAGQASGDSGHAAAALYGWTGCLAGWECSGGR